MCNHKHPGTITLSKITEKTLLYDYKMLHCKRQQNVQI